MLQANALSFSPQSRFTGNKVHHDTTVHSTSITMRKQKASDKRTSRMQKNHDTESFTDTIALRTGTSPLTPMSTGQWKHKTVVVMNQLESTGRLGGRGRSRKRSAVYSNLASYHGQFLELLTKEFLAEESVVRDRIDAAAGDSMQSLLLESAGHALFDMFPERKGNIFSDEVYRLVKAKDATSTFSLDKEMEDDGRKGLPQNSKFSQNDVVMLTMQPANGDFSGSSSTPTNKDATSIEARVLGTGPTYVDVAIQGGRFEATFGPAPNNFGPSGQGDKNIRLRIDRYFSNVPYNRMVEAIGQLTTIPPKKTKEEIALLKEAAHKDSSHRRSVDGVIRQTILNSFAFSNEESPMCGDLEASKLNDLAKQIAKPPLQDSSKLTNQVLGYFQSNPQQLFSPFNGPQLSAIGAALTRKLTMIHGPPGTGKTTVAASIAFGFVHQCRTSPNLPKHSKVLVTAFSNVGADNLAEQLIRLGLKVVRVGKASAVTKGLWDYTLDAAIARDPHAKKALEDATKATSNLRGTSAKPGKKGSGRGKLDIASERNKRDLATAAVKASIEACNVAATKAMREADVIVSTSIGAADKRLLAACGMLVGEDEKEAKINDVAMFAPDGLPPLSLPFVIVDEACQSVEPGSLIPVFSTNSCRSLVMLGDPCQLPPTVVSDESGTGESPLSVSLMSRLSMALPQPVIVTAQVDKSPRDELYLNLKMTRQAASIVRHKGGSGSDSNVSYRKRYSGSLLLSVQYRMHPSIAAFSSAVFYDSMLSTPKFLTNLRPLPQELDDILPLERGQASVRFVNIAGSQNERRGDPATSTGILLSDIDPSLQSSSYTNEAEAAQLVHMLKEFMKNRVGGSTPFDGTIGVITPYSGQVILLKSMIASDPELRNLMQKNPIDLEINSIDAYQGRERDLIFFSTVRSNRKGNVGFLTDWRRMNVALTRAKVGLVVFGDMDTLVNDHHWEAFCGWCENVECVFDVDSAELSGPSFE